MLYDNYCRCGKYLPTPAINKRGDLPTVFCSRICETKAKNEERMTKRLVNTYREMPKRYEPRFPKETPQDHINRYGSGGGQ